MCGRVRVSTPAEGQMELGGKVSRKQVVYRDRSVGSGASCRYQAVVLVIGKLAIILSLFICPILAGLVMQ